MKMSTELCQLAVLTAIWDVTVKINQRVIDYTVGLSWLIEQVLVKGDVGTIKA